MRRHPERRLRFVASKEKTFPPPPPFWSCARLIGTAIRWQRSRAPTPPWAMTAMSASVGDLARSRSVALTIRRCASAARSQPWTLSCGRAKNSSASASNSFWGRYPVEERSFSPSSSITVIGRAGTCQRL